MTAAGSTLTQVLGDFGAAYERLVASGAVRQGTAPEEEDE